VSFNWYLFTGKGKCFSRKYNIHTLSLKDYWSFWQGGGGGGEGWGGEGNTAIIKRKVNA